MIAVLTGSLLATAAGLNAYIPLLGLALLARFTPIVTLPEGWQWLTSNWALLILGVLLIIELVVDKVPALDTVNDVLQTLIRPASGGMVFAAGIGSETVAVSDAEAMSNVESWWPVIVGVLIALVPHIAKAIGRPIVNTMTGGAAAPAMSTVEDGGAIGLSVLAVVAPVLGALFAMLLIIFLVRRIKKARSSTRRTGPEPSGSY